MRRTRASWPNVAEADSYEGWCFTLTRARDGVVSGPLFYPQFFASIFALNPCAGCRIYLYANHCTTFVRSHYFRCVSYFISIFKVYMDFGLSESAPSSSPAVVCVSCNKKLLHHSNSWMTTHMCSDVTMFQDSSFNEFIYFLIDAHVFRSFGSINSSINLTNQMSDGHWTHKCSSRRRL